MADVAEPSELSVVVVSMRPSLDFVPIYGHCYHPTVHEAEVVAVRDNTQGHRGRVIETLRAIKPVKATEPVCAAELYSDWTGRRFAKDVDKAMAADNKKSVTILQEASDFPLQRVRKRSAGQLSRQSSSSELGVVAMSATTEPSVLLHPAFIHPDGSLQTFAEVSVGDRVGLLCVVSVGLVSVAGAVSVDFRFVPAEALLLTDG